MTTHAMPKKLWLIRVANAQPAPRIGLEQYYSEAGPDYAAWSPRVQHALRLLPRRCESARSRIHAGANECRSAGPAAVSRTSRNPA